MFRKILKTKIVFKLFGIIKFQKYINRAHFLAIKWT